MRKITLHGHRPAFLNTTDTEQVLNTVARPPSATLPPQTGTDSGSVALEENVKKVNLGFIKLKIHPGSLAESALRTQTQKIKQKAKKPYTSHNGVQEVKLNCQVKVRPDESLVSASQSVVCRHLATMFAEHSGKKSELMQAFSTRDGVIAKFDGKLTEVHVAFKKAVREAPSGCKQLVSSEQLGSYLQAIAKQLQAPRAEGPSQANCLLLTAEHVMALHVERKRKNGVDYVVAKLYDPNETATYRRVVKATPEDFGALRLKDMMVSPQLISVYSGVEKNKPLSMVSLSLDHRLQPRMDRNPTVPSVENIHLALAWGVPDEVHSMLEAVLNGSKTPKERFELLQANTTWNGAHTPGLFRAMTDGHANTVEAFAQRVVTSNLSQIHQIDLLAAKSGDMPGLFLAFQNGDADVVMAFTQVVLGSSLNPQPMVDLLAAKHRDGKSGLFVALQAGHSNMVQAFTQLVLDSNLNPQDMADLLGAKNNDGVPGLFVALKGGHSETVQAFAQRVLDSNINPQDMADLLVAKSSDGVPGLFMAFKRGHSDAVKAFAKGVLSSNLSERAKVDLLAAKNGDGTSGLRMARGFGRRDPVKAFEQEVLSSNLSQDSKNYLLS